MWSGVYNAGRVPRSRWSSSTSTPTKFVVSTHTPSTRAVLGGRLANEGFLSINPIVVLYGCRCDECCGEYKANQAQRWKRVHLQNLCLCWRKCYKWKDVCSVFVWIICVMFCVYVLYIDVCWMLIKRAKSGKRKLSWKKCSKICNAQLNLIKLCGDGQVRK